MGYPSKFPVTLQNYGFRADTGGIGTYRGGCGVAMERNPEKVREDVLDGYVTREAAQEQFGVIFRDDFTIDENASAALRMYR